jgi:biotin carboxylase
LKFPIILKPTNKGGKRGITVVYSPADIHDAFAYAEKSVGTDVEFIVEEYIDGGKEFSVESLTYHGKHHIVQITEKISSGAPHCVELGHHQPGNLSDEMKMQVVEVLKKALTQIGIVEGPCHTEIKIKDNIIYLIEFNARPGGDHIAYPLTNLSTGYQYIKGIIKVAFDEVDDINEDQFEHNAAGVLFVTEQTKYLKPLFDVCENYDWCYKKNEVSIELSPLQYNDGYNTNFFMYFSKDGRPDFERILASLKK